MYVYASFAYFAWPTRMEMGNGIETVSFLGLDGKEGKFM